MGSSEAVLRATVDGLPPADRERALAAIDALVADRDRARDEAQELAYVSSHDLNEPLRMVRSYLGLLERRCGDQLDERAKEFLWYAVDGAARGQALLDDLLRYSRLNTMEKAPEAVDLDALVAEVHADAPGLRVEGRLGAVHADPRQARILLEALLDNAQKFVAPGAAPQVTVERAPDGTVVVADRGIGIDPKHHERIFRVFQRLHAREEHPGNGIGLALARRVVEGHGGRLWVESAPGEGSRFCFALPA